MTLRLLISPEARSAYFADYLSVAETELRLCCPGAAPVLHQVGGLDFFEIEQGDPEALARLSFVQGMFEVAGGGLHPLGAAPQWALHRDFIFGSKFKGKTNERLTQLLLNFGLAVTGKAPADVRLLDPMCGRATTLLWAMAYGMRAYGIDEDTGAIADVQRNVKKWAKLTRTKHKLETGFLTKKNKRGDGAFLDFKAGGSTLRMAQGDGSAIAATYGKQRFDLIVSDLPYGVQHTSNTARNPLDILRKCAVEWGAHLSEGGAAVLAFNANNPKRKVLEDVFSDADWTIGDISAPHRMSESILRDVLVLQR